MDPISIAGLTIAVLDALWKVSERTADLISNFKDFDNDTRALENKIRNENNRTKALRRLLFEPSPVYGGRALFEQFDNDVQNEMQIFFEQARGIIDEAFQILIRRHCKADSGSEQTGRLQLGGSTLFSPKSPHSPSLSPTSTLATYESMGSPAIASTHPSSRSCSTENLKQMISMRRLRWSLIDKRRVEAIVNSFSDVNARIHENVKLWCLGASVGIDLQHLHRLEYDQDSKQLGFDLDAKLHIIASGSGGANDAKSLEIGDLTFCSDVRQAALHESRFGVFSHAGKSILVDYRCYNLESPVPVPLDDRSKELIERLANLLHQPKEIIFRTPNCIGWVRQPSLNRAAFLFEVPEDAQPVPVSLLRALGSDCQTQAAKVPVPPLGQRFRLAYMLARCISQLQLVKWVHESFRSENILFFPHISEGDAGLSTPLTERLKWSSPWVLGYEFSRPEMYFSHGHADYNPARDVYRHPDRQQSPKRTFNKLHDIYALGVILLEIGLWQPALSLEKHGFKSVKDPFAIQKYLVRTAEKRLVSKMGEKYQCVVLRCLRSDFDGVDNDTKEDLRLQVAFRSQAVEVLEKIADAV